MDDQGRRGKQETNLDVDESVGVDMHEDQIEGSAGHAAVGLIQDGWCELGSAFLCDHAIGVWERRRITSDSRHQLDTFFGFAISADIGYKLLSHGCVLAHGGAAFYPSDIDQEP